MKRVLTYIGHLAIAWPGVILVVFGGSVLLGGPNSTILDTLVDPPGFLLEILVGFGLGLILNARRPSRAACWVWVPPALVFVWDVFQWVHSGTYLADGIGPWADVWGTYFGTACEGCLAGLLITAPLYTAAVYSLGAWLALRRWAGRAAGTADAAPQRR